MDTGLDWEKWRAQLIVIVLAAGLAWAIVGSGEGREIESPPSPKAAFDMLSFLGEKVGFQEDHEEVKAARISEHMRLIQALYESSALQVGDGGKRRRFSADTG
tara:strand:- start:54 stop:362 length:309 start_codon:yes stop_codon:yes gene_type:complete